MSAGISWGGERRLAAGYFTSLSVPISKGVPSWLVMLVHCGGGLWMAIDYCGSLDVPGSCNNGCSSNNRHRQLADCFSVIALCIYCISFEKKSWDYCIWCTPSLDTPHLYLSHWTVIWWRFYGLMPFSKVSLEKYRILIKKYGIETIYVWGIEK